MSDVINPGAVPIPPVRPDEVESAGGAIKSDGTKIAQTGHDIHSDWQGLRPFYIAPEATLLLAKTRPVSDKGDDFETAAETAGDALVAFADEVRPIIARLKSLKADAVAFRSDINDDDSCQPKDDWREDEGDVERHNKLNNDIMAAVNEYQAAERTCANKITGLFGGTHWVAGALDGSTKGNVYGFADAPKDVETPWAKPQEYDAPWYEDTWNGIKDFGVGIAQDLSSLVGMYGEDGWGWQGLDNLGNNWEAMAGGLVGLFGLYGPDGWGWQGLDNLGNNWKEFAHAFVPWREWGDRPGYVITQSVLNIGSVFLGGAGLAKGLIRAGIKIGRKGDADAPNLDADDIRVSDTRPFDDLPTTRDLQNQLDSLDLDDNGALDGLDDALKDADNLDNTPDRQPAHIGGDTDTNGSDTDRGDHDPTPDRGDSNNPDQDSSNPDPDHVDTDSDLDHDGKGPDGDATPDSDGDTTPDGEFSPSGSAGQELIDELAQNGVKHIPEDIVSIARGPDGKVIFLETGNPRAGLAHIIDRHGSEFAQRGIPENKIPDVVMTALTKGEVVGTQRGRPIYEFTYNGQTHRLAVSVGDNGFIVGANFRSMRG